MSPADPFTPGLLNRLPQPLRKVALVRPSRIGDFICATPAFRALRAALPEAGVAIITLPILQDLAVRSPYFDRFIPFPGFPGLAEQLFDARRTTRFFQEMQAEEFDLAVQLQGSGLYSNPFTLLLGARITAGFTRDREYAGRLDAALPLPTTGHEVQRVLALPLFLGAPSQGEEPEYPLWPEDHLRAEALLAQHQRPLIGLHPGAWDSERQWPPARFAAVANTLLQRYGGTAVILGGAQARSQASAVAEAISGPIVNLAGQISLGLLGGIVTRLAVLVTNDSGPAHVGYALGAPTITLFGPSDPGRYGPLQNGPFRLVLPPAASNIEAISVSQVISVAQEILNL